MIITLGGKSGSGKSSVSKALAAKLGYKRYSAGDIWRQCAAERGMSVFDYNKQAMVEPEIDTEADEVQKKLGQTENNIVVESRLGFFFIPSSIKIFLDAHDKVRANRTMEHGRAQENHKSLKEAFEKLDARDKGDIMRYEKLYKINPFDMKHYDLVIDTTSNTIEQTVNEIMAFLKKQRKI